MIKKMKKDNKKEYVIENPFSVRINKNGMNVITLGNLQIIEREFGTQEEAEAVIRDKDWDLIGNYALLIAESVYKKIEQLKAEQETNDLINELNAEQHNAN